MLLHLCWLRVVNTEMTIDYVLKGLESVQGCNCRALIYVGVIYQKTEQNMVCGRCCRLRC